MVFSQPGNPCNGDSELYPTKIGNYSKGLPHNELGEVDLIANGALIRVLSTGESDVFELIPLRGVTKLTDPQAAYAFELAGPDSHHLSIIPPPTLSSAQEASEMAEDYWMALARDVPFTDYGTNPITLAAVADLSKFSDFRGPKVNGVVTPEKLFRGNVPGDLVVDLIFPSSSGRRFLSEPEQSISAIVRLLQTTTSLPSTRNG